MSKSTSQYLSTLNRRVFGSFRTGLGRTGFLCLFVFGIPLLWGVQILICASILKQVTTPGSGPLTPTASMIIAGSLLLTVGLTIFFCHKLSKLLLWVRVPTPAKARVESRDQLETAALQRRRLPFQEHRAQGDRVIVDGLAFRYGMSRKILEKANWYRN